MKQYSEKIVHVKYYQNDKPVSVGRLAIKERKIFFEYAENFLEKKIELSPFKLPLQSGVIECNENVFEGLFGVFNDSLPDGWGRLLLDRNLMKLNISPQTLTPLDRLRYVGSHGMGALRYEPEIVNNDYNRIINDLDVIAEECLEFQESHGDNYVEDLLVMNGSSAGARPKILVRLEENKNIYKIPINKPHKIANDWIIKFSSSMDPKDIGPIEFAYHLMAKEAGIEVPDAKLFKSKKTAGFFGVKRFDREDKKFIHMHTASGLLHADYRIPSMDYKTLINATLWLTKDIREAEKIFKYAVFNVLSHNRDDHAKNFSFLMSEQGVWRVSPAYDLTFSAGPAGEHCTTILGKGKNVTFQDLIRLSEVASIKRNRALEIIDEVKGAISQWKCLAKNAGVKNASLSHVHSTLNKIRIS